MMDNESIVQSSHIQTLIAHLPCLSNFDKKIRTNVDKHIFYTHFHKHKIYEYLNSYGICVESYHDNNMKII